MAVTVALIVYAVATAGSGAEHANPSAISLNLLWTYALLMVALGVAVFCVALGMIKDPSGVKGSVISLCLSLLVIGAAYFISMGNELQILDIQNGNYFDDAATLISQTSMIVTYFAFAAAVVTTIATEVYGAFK